MSKWIKKYIHTHTCIYVYIHSHRRLPCTPPDPQEKICPSALRRTSSEKMFITSATGAQGDRHCERQNVFPPVRELVSSGRKFRNGERSICWRIIIYGMLLSKDVPRTQLIQTPKSMQSHSFPGTRECVIVSPRPISRDFVEVLQNCFWFRQRIAIVEWKKSLDQQHWEIIQPDTVFGSFLIFARHDCVLAL